MLAPVITSAKDLVVLKSIEICDLLLLAVLYYEVALAELEFIHFVDC